MQPEILALVPARGGSKGIPRKNLRAVAGKPLIVWTIESGHACPLVARVVVSTDDEEIAEVARGAGAQVPFLRPAALARDDTPDFPVYQHALHWLREHEGYQPDAVVWLRPTAPLRSPDDIAGAIALLVESGADTVRSVCLAEHHPFWMKRLEGDRLVPFVPDADEHSYPRRQLLPPVYRLNGAVDVRWATEAPFEGSSLFGGTMAGYVMPPERSVDVDREVELSLVESLLGQRAGAS